MQRNSYPDVLPNVEDLERMSSIEPGSFDVIVIGGGQSGLALGYYLRRTGLSYVILDASGLPGGSWPQYWDSLQLFSPAQWSSLPGMLMDGGTSTYPGRDEVINYLDRYEQKYQLNIRRPVAIDSVEKVGNQFILNQDWHCRALVNATGSFSNPIVPEIEGIDSFKGEILHAKDYKSPASFINKTVAVVGEGNSGAQIIAELSALTEAYWITDNAPEFLPDHIDGKYLFDAATQIYEAKKQGKTYTPPSLGHIVMVPSVKAARDRGALINFPKIKRLSVDGAVLMDDRKISFDAIIFCIGYRPALKHLKSLPITLTDEKIPTHATKSRELAGLWMVGYGGWTGFASATLIGVGRTAKATVREIEQFFACNGQ